MESSKIITDLEHERRSCNENSVYYYYRSPRRPNARTIGEVDKPGIRGGNFGGDDSDDSLERSPSNVSAWNSVLSRNMLVWGGLTRER